MNVSVMSIKVTLLFVTCVKPIHPSIDPSILTYIHTYIHTYIRTYVRTRTHVHTYTRTHVHTYIHTYIRTYVRTHVHTYTCTYVHTYMHTYINTYIHKQTNTRTHAHIHTETTHTNIYLSNIRFLSFVYVFHRQLRELIINLACIHGDRDCLNNMTELFRGRLSGSRQDHSNLKWRSNQISDSRTVLLQES